VAKKKAAKKQARPKPKAAAAKKKPASSKAVRAKSAGKPKAPPADDAAAIGRVLVTQEEKLYMLFKEDYHARQIFEFLRVETVKDLEQFSPEQIVRLLSKPIRTTVDRIRQKLAEKNRHLLEDVEYAAEWKREHPRAN
jgi:hypothetical protein